MKEKKDQILNRKKDKEKEQAIPKEEVKENPLVKDLNEL
jgi:hypothetical protein